MRIAVASDGLDVAKHFLQCRNINYYTTSSLEVADSKNVPAEGLSCEEYAFLMDTIGVDVLVCNQILPDCRSAFENRGITVVEGASGNALKAAQEYAHYVLLAEEATA